MVVVFAAVAAAFVAVVVSTAVASAALRRHFAAAVFTAADFGEVARLLSAAASGAVPHFTAALTAMARR